jgi:hypothetical protein
MGLLQYNLPKQALIAFIIPVILHANACGHPANVLPSAAGVF